MSNHLRTSGLKKQNDTEFPRFSFYFIYSRQDAEKDDVLEMKIGTDEKKKKAQRKLSALRQRTRRGARSLARQKFWINNHSISAKHHRKKMYPTTKAN